MRWNVDVSRYRRSVFGSQTWSREEPYSIKAHKLGPDCLSMLINCVTYNLSFLFDFLMEFADLNLHMEKESLRIKIFRQHMVTISSIICRLTLIEELLRPFGVVNRSMATGTRSTIRIWSCNQRTYRSRHSRLCRFLSCEVIVSLRHHVLVRH